MILGYLLIFCAIGGALLALMTIIGVTVFDVQKIRKKRLFKQHPYAKRYRERPVISVMVLARGDEQKMKRCLDSLAKSSYRKIEIILVDTLPHSRMRRFVKKYTTPGLKRKITVFKSNRHPTLAVMAAYRRHGNGQLVTVINGTSVIDARAFAQVVWEFNADRRLQAVSLNDQVAAAFSSIGLLQTYENLLIKLSKKTKSAFNTSYITPAENTVYRKDAVMANTFGNKRQRTSYADSAVVYKEASGSFYVFLKGRFHLQLDRLHGLADRRSKFFTRDTEYTKFATWIYLPFAIYIGFIALLLPLLFGYFIYLVLALHQPVLFILSWVILSIFLLFAVWSDEHVSLRQKAVYSLLMPVTYVTAYLLSFVQLFVTLRFAFSLLRH